MGMFDSFYTPEGEEFQTKSLSCELVDYRVGDRVSRFAIDFQVEIYTSRGGKWIDTYATVIGGRVAEVDVPRDDCLPLA